MNEKIRMGSNLNPKKNYLLNLIPKLLFVIVFLNLLQITQSTLHGQNSLATKTISGTVVDKANLPIPGVSVFIKNTSIGTITDIDGKYVLAQVPNDGIVVFSFIGMKTKEIMVSDQLQINVVLDDQSIGLDEVVAIAYGNTTQRKSTGSLQSIKSKELTDIPVTQFTQKLQGKFAGVNISQGTGKPGQGLNIQIRGAASLSTNSSPLCVIDGFPVSGGVIDLNPNEIESISILKDAASTSLYGSRAAFGVVLITTKKAKSGKSNISINAYSGFQIVPDKGRPDVMNGTEWARFKKEYYEDLGQSVPEAYQNPEQYGKGYDWYDAMLRTGTINDYSLTISSSKGKLSSSVVGGYFKQKGVMLNSDYTRFSLRTNVKYDLSDKLTIGVNLAPTYNIDNSPSTDGQFFSGGGMLSNATLTPPILSYKNADGSYPVTVTTPGVTSFPTPNWVRSIKEITNKTIDTRLIANEYIQYEVLDGLKLKSAANVELVQTLVHYFQPSTAGRAFASAPGQLTANLRETNRRFWTWLTENTMEYSKEINGHNLDVLAGFTSQKYRYDQSVISGYNYTDDRVETIDAALVKNNPTMDIQEWSMLSYLTRLSYDYKSKYLLTASIRRDGSSRFGKDNKWGNFPAVAVGWVVSEEPFMSKFDWVSFLKVRSSYGVTGNNNIGNYTQYSTVEGDVNTTFNNTTYSGSAVTNLGNDDLGWEKTKEFDLGVDLAFFKDRVALTYDYYKKETSNLLYTLSVPIESGFSSFTGNVGKIRFWGHEFNINSDNLVGKFKWSSNFNISFSDNKVLALSSLSDQLIVWQGFVSTRTKVGGRIGQYFGLKQEGVYKNQADFDSSPKLVDSEVGTIKFKDVNGDGVITTGVTENDDRTEIGNPFPKFVYGFTNNFKYKNLDLSIVAKGSYGNKVVAALEQGMVNLDGVFNVLRDVEDRWRSEENPGAGLYGKTTGSTSHDRDDFHSRYVKDGSYFTIKNITLGYTVPSKIASFIQSLRVYASVQQAFVFTNYKYGNPEVGVDFNGNQPSSTTQGIDFSAYPVPRTFTFGVNVNLK
ncbi:SusC/RagA family TonB-linked outer membrane protein [Plebeiibacterium marinum]|uniref:TonB-dependent receptor n=1 Tax=Plebeiibacterium marinum TaxID=2992111 RepID=A0AAE3MD09_9BACT|nr:TonB-dependent receptor [Plebeiobacterium marinum]MCW3805350.1 TonB-dependent receptor [Plebeiobacterium marinum]